MNFRTVNRADKDDGSDQHVVWEGGAEDQLGEIRVIRKEDLQNKGGCVCVCVCVCVCGCGCVCACVHACMVWCMCVCVRAVVYTYECV